MRRMIAVKGRHLVAAIGTVTGTGAAVAIAAGGGAVASTGGCATHQCDSELVELGGDEGPFGAWHVEAGELVWESSPVNGAWLDFPGNRTYAMTLPPLPALPPGLEADVAHTALPLTYVADTQGTDAGPEAGGAPPGNFAQTTGQLTEITSWTGQLWPASTPYASFFNPTCAHYYLYVRVEIPLKAASDADASSGVDEAAAPASSD